MLLAKTMHARPVRPRARWFGPLATLALLAACNGQEGVTVAPAHPLATPSAQAAAPPSSAPAPEPTAATAEALLDWAESSRYGPSWFWPHAATGTAGPFRYRHYPRTGVYLGLVVSPDPVYRLGGVYVMGGAFGDTPRYVGQQADFMTLPADPPDTGALAFTPGRLSANFNEGDSPSLNLVATPRTPLSGTVYVVVEDLGRVLARVNPVVIDQLGRAVTNISPREDLPLGLHEGTLNVHLCRTANCSSTWPGSPVPLPYRFGVVRQDPSLGFFASDSVLTATLPPGATGTLSVNALSNRWPTPPLHFRVLDASGRVSGGGALPAAPGGVAQPVTLTLTLPEAAGRYDGSFAVQGCRDAACTLPMQTSRFDYITFRAVAGLVDAAVGATPNLRTLNALPGAGDWAGAQGSSAHSGYVPGTLDVARFGLRWHWALPEGKAYTLGPPATGGGRVALAAQGFAGSSDTELFVLDELTGALQWRHGQGGTAHGVFSPPVVADGRVFSSTVNLDDRVGVATTLRAFDLASGRALYSTAVPTQWHASLPPVLAGQRVLVDGGYGNGVASLDAATGALQWQVGARGYTWWSAAWDGSSLYTYGSGAFAAHRPDTGEASFRVEDSALANGFGAGPRRPLFAVADGRAFVVDNGNLVVFSTRDGAVQWRQDTRNFVGGTAVQGSTVIALQQAPLRVEARHVADGRLLWSTQPLFDVTQGYDQAFVSEPLLTDNLVFISTERGVYALSREDGRARWYYGKPGTLALSARGVLLIANPGLPGLGHGVTAINLQ
jgi:outer membrane protein assembly factor BamB